MIQRILTILIALLTLLAVALLVSGGTGELPILLVTLALLAVAVIIAARRKTTRT